jgi:hypothetical protein
MSFKYTYAVCALFGCQRGKPEIIKQILAKLVRDVAVVSRRHRTIHLVKRVPDSEMCTHLIELP